MWFNKMPWCQDLDTDMLKCDQKEASVIHGGGLSSEPCGTYFWNYISKEKKVYSGKLLTDVLFHLDLKRDIQQSGEYSSAEWEQAAYDWKGEMERYFCPRGTPMTSICLAAYLETTENL